MVVMGQIGAPFGVKGWMHLRCFNPTRTNLLSDPHWQLLTQGEWEPITVSAIKPHGQSFVVRFENVETRDAAQAFTNRAVGLPRERLPTLPKDVYYWVDLIGLRVITENAEVLGVVDTVFEAGANDVLVVKNAVREHLIPFVLGEYVLKVDVEQQTIWVSWDPEF